MQLTGSCFCSAVEWEAEVDTNRIGLCHCRDCQIISGGAFRMSSAVDPKKFRFSKGSPREFEKTADSGSVRKMVFCGECGTHLCSMPADTEKEGAFVSIRLATSPDFSKLNPIAELFCDSRVPWLPDIGGTLKFPRMPVIPPSDE